MSTETNEPPTNAIESSTLLDCTLHYHRNYFIVKRGEDTILYQPITEAEFERGLSLGQIINEIRDVS